MIRLGILGSTRGTSMLAIIKAIEEKNLNATICLVASNKPDALILERAKSYGLPAKFIDPTHLTREAYDQYLSLAFTEHQIDLIVLVGYMRILSPAFCNQWANQIINVHPSLLPAFAKKMNLQVHQAVLTAGVKVTGCTVHYVTEELDAGDIVVQKRCSVLDGDTPERLRERVQQLEGDALIEAINIIRMC